MATPSSVESAADGTVRLLLALLDWQSRPYQFLLTRHMKAGDGRAVITCYQCLELCLKMFRTLARWFLRLFDALDGKYRKTGMAIKALVVSAPTAALGYATLRLGHDLPLQEDIRNFLAARPLWVGGFLAWPFLGTVGLNLLSDFMGRLRGLRRMKEDELAALLVGLTRVMNSKLATVRRFQPPSPATTVDCGTLLRSLLRPQAHLETLVIELHQVLTHVTGDNTLELVLAEIDGDIPVRAVCAVPNDVIVSDRLFGDGAKQTLFHCCAKSQRPIDITDIAKHIRGQKQRRDKKRYLPTGDAEDNRGSILCLPIYYNELRRVLYVLSVKSEQEKAVNAKAFLKKYKYIFDAFDERILLEGMRDLIVHKLGTTYADNKVA